MTKYAKWIGAGLGWAFGGPLGALLGFVFGSMMQDMQVERYAAGNPNQKGAYRHHTTQSDFMASLLVLSASVMKADGKVLKSELAYVRTFLVAQFGEKVAMEQLLLLRDLLDKNIPLKEVCEQIRYNMEHPMRLQLLHYLFGISKADGHVSLQEVELLSTISGYLGIRQADYESIQAMFYKDARSAYLILEVSESAGDDEIKKAYRRMAVKYHPDKVAQLGQEVQRAAKEKFQKVQEAYELIKKERNMI